MGELDLVVVPHDVGELELRRSRLVHPPEQERTDRVPAQEAVEQPAHLIRAPPELALDVGEHVVVPVDAVQRIITVIGAW